MKTNTILAHIEIYRNSKAKYEYNKELGVFVMDRELTIPYPENYGYIPNTLSEDSDPLDVFVLSNEPFPRDTYIRIIPQRIIYMTDNGAEDNKIIASTEGYSYNIDRSTTYLNIINFLKTYKKGTEIISLGSKKEAIEMIKNAQNQYEMRKNVTSNE